MSHAKHNKSAREIPHNDVVTENNNQKFRDIEKFRKSRDIVYRMTDEEEVDFRTSWLMGLVKWIEQSYGRGSPYTKTCVMDEKVIHIFHHIVSLKNPVFDLALFFIGCYFSHSFRNYLLGEEFTEIKEDPSTKQLIEIHHHYSPIHNKAAFLQFLKHDVRKELIHLLGCNKNIDVFDFVSRLVPKYFMMCGIPR